MKYHSESERFAEAYIVLAERARYRPGAPGDGLGSINLTPEQLRDSERLRREALDYGIALSQSLDQRSVFIGVPNWSTSKAFFYALEAARLLCAGVADRSALTVLELAVEELKQCASKGSSGEVIDID